LIELLVVIAIIGILAAMVFPVFARARESARKAVCLSNVKNIALAIQMYLGDNNDCLPGWEYDQRALDYMTTGAGGGTRGPCEGGWEARMAWSANPYLRWPVLLDEYTKNRDVWRCPSAKMESGATFILPGPDWVAYLHANEGSWGGGDYYNMDAFGPCIGSWPVGWGGAVTDSIIQQRLATSGGDTAMSSAGSSGTQLRAFVQGINSQIGSVGLKLVQVDQPASYMIISDSGLGVNSDGIGVVAYPDICCATCSGFYEGAGLDDPDCAPDAECVDCRNLHAGGEFWTRGPEYRKQYTRHLGGVNLGFLDGHATWINSASFCAKVGEGTLPDLWPSCPSSAHPGTCEDLGAQYLY
jgi:prepilin-type processing-associated H-X9-DG protein